MNKNVLEQLYQNYYGVALIYVTALCSDKNMAEDIVADAFVKAYLSLPNDCPSFQYWLFRVCKNLWIDYIRKNKHFTSDEMIMYMSTKETPESVLLQDERNKALWNAIGTLSPLDRELVTLHYFSGLSLQEVAGILDKSYTAVRQRISRLRLTLKQRMEEQGYEF